ncbi:FAD-dependent oxidoreductase [Candidatus Poribacteria bacterium]|nr:FAD-dependent oxidoreductase [Candidatus Poribacteria bacterium]
MKHESEVLIIGGGVIGICSAYYLIKRGRKVVVVDKGEICSGSSYGNAGLVVPSHSVPLAAPGVLSKGLKWMFDSESPFYIKPRFDLELFKWLWKFRSACNERHVQKAMPFIRDLSFASLQLYEEFAAQNDLEFGFEKQGMLMVFKTEKGLKDGVEEAYLMQEIGLEVKILNPAEIQELEPNIRINAIGGVFYPQDAHLIPARFVRELARHIETEGADIHTNTEVLGFETSNRKLTTVKTTRGDFVADEVVLASGSWSPGIAKDLQIKLPIQPAKGYSVTVERPEKCPVRPLVLADAKVAVTPMGETLRFAGTLEMAGLDLSINKRRVNAILKAVPQYLPDIRPENQQLIEIWRGLRPCTPDGLPFLGRLSTYDNLTIAAGHAMIGLSLGPITGKLVSQVVGHEKPEIDLTMLKVERFG